MKPQKPIRKKSQRKAEIDKLWKQAKKERIEELGNICEINVLGICRHRGETLHHVIKRSQGGSHTKDNGRLACLPCHNFLELNEQWAIDHGFSKKGNKQFILTRKEFYEQEQIKEIE